MMFFSDFHTYIDIYHYSNFDLGYIFYHQSYIHTCMIYVLLEFFILVSYYECFGTHTLLDISLKVLQLQTHLSKLTANG